MSAFNVGWKFYLGDMESAWQKGFDDSGWREVTLPHDWSVESPFDRRHSSGTGYLPGGTAFYRKSFTLPEQAKGRCITVTFDGVYKNAQLWINGSYLGRRPYGYTTFSFDISEFCVFGENNNVIAVKVSHEDIGDSRWFTGSGIYRKVTLSIREREHIKDGSLFVWTEQADAQAAILRAAFSFNNEAASEAEAVCTIFNPDGTEAACGRTSTDGEAAFTLTVENPRLWSVDMPHLYKVEAEIRRDGRVLDRVTLLTGIRTFHFDADQGFTLNGVSMKLKGVCVHHDAGCLGAAVPAGVWRSRLETLKAIGANALRTSHNPPMPELLDLCDEMGFLVIDEAFDEWEGCKNKWTTGHNVYPPRHYGYYEHFPEWHAFDLTAMVLRDRNHPSVIMWSVGNEIDYPNDPYGHPLFKTFTGNNDANKPKAELMYNPDKPNAERLPVIARTLSAIVKQNDKTRPVSAAVAFPELSNQTGFSACFDVIGYNYKEALYADIHRAHPEWIILGSENSHGYDEWLYVRDNDYIAGQFLWTGIDFLGETQGWPCHGSHAGLLNLAGQMKPRAWYRQSLWSDKPMAKLFARAADAAYLRDEGWRENWNFSDGDEVEVVCYTNALQAELFLNDVSLGQKTSQRHMVTWRVPYAAGTLRVAAGEAADTMTTASAPVAIRLTSDRNEICADGQDIAIIRAEITDRDGRVTDDAAHRLFVEVAGGTLLGLENGDLSDTQEYTAASRHAYNGRLTIYARTEEQAGDMLINVRSPKLRGQMITVRVSPSCP